MQCIYDGTKVIANRVKLCLCYKGMQYDFIEVLRYNFTLIKNIACLQMNTGPTTSRLEKERARKRAKRTRETPSEKERRLNKNRERNMLRRNSESEAQRLQRLAAGQQREADRRASESEA